jgi:hypothetical protein
VGFKLIGPLADSYAYTAFDSLTAKQPPQSDGLLQTICSVKTISVGKGEHSCRHARLLNNLPGLFAPVFI